MTKLPPMLCKPHRIPYCRQCMMEKTTDLEMLEWAAKAAGIEFTIWHDKPAQVINYGNHLRETRFWNPLTDDGDALRLAVKLGIVVEYRREVPACFAYHYALNLEVMQRNDQLDGYAATRLAIVRAASEIGRKNMK